MILQASVSYFPPSDDPYFIGSILGHDLAINYPMTLIPSSIVLIYVSSFLMLNQ